MEPDDFALAYQQRAVIYAELGPVMENLVRQLVAAAGIRIHSVNHRVKAPDSLQRKMARGGSGYASIDDLQDMLGVRVITYFPDEVDQVAKVIESEFMVDLDNSVDKRALLDPDRFGYLSLHYVVSLNEQRAKLSEHARFAGLQTEIQIRSVLQHAWAEIEHDLGYKTPAAVPSSIRRRFSRLAGLLEIADSEFETLRRDVGSYKEQVGERVEDSPDDLPVDRDSLLAYASVSKQVAEIDEFIRGNCGLDGVIPITDSFANSLVEEFQLLGVETIGDVDRELRARAEQVKRFFPLWLEDRHMGEVIRGTSLFYLTWVLAGALQDEQAVVHYVKTVNFGGDPTRTAKRVLQVYAEATQEQD